MTETTGTPAVETIKTAIEDILKTIDQEREREIITRRFGLYERRETLEQIGELLGITRERVRQLEKAILARLKTAAADGKIPAISDAERLIIRDLSENGRVGRVQDVANRLSKDKASNNTRAHVAFIGELSPRFVIINETFGAWPSGRPSILKTSAIKSTLFWQAMASRCTSPTFLKPSKKATSSAETLPLKLSTTNSSKTNASS